MNQPDPNQNINIVKPVALERLGLHNFIINPLALSTEQRLLYSNLTKQLVSEYSNDTSLKSLLVDEYNTLSYRLLYIQTSVWMLRTPNAGRNIHFQHFLC